MYFSNRVYVYGFHTMLHSRMYKQSNTITRAVYMPQEKKIYIFYEEINLMQEL